MSKLIHKSYKFRIYPTKTQEVLLSKTFGCTRLVYNRALNSRIEQYKETGKSDTYIKQAAKLTMLKKCTEFNFLCDVDIQSLQSSLKNLDVAYKNFFRTKKGFPKFKNKYSKQSYRTSVSPKITDDGKLSIGKFRKTNALKIKTHTQINGRILSVTISKSTTGKYFASLCCEVEYVPYNKSGKSTGIDVGVKDLATLSDDTIYINHKTLRKYSNQLAYEQRQLSKKIKGSKSRNKQCILVSKIHEKVTNTRKYYLHKITTEIVKNHDIICIEDLDIKAMLQHSKNMARTVSDSSMGTFIRYLTYKADWNDKEIIKVDRYYPSSQICSNCNVKNKQMKDLNLRKLLCKSCGSILDRDLNAAINIHKEGLKIYKSGLSFKSDSKQKQEESLTVVKAVKPEVNK